MHREKMLKSGQGFEERKRLIQAGLVPFGL
jgi:hypothetical protein